MLPRSATTEGAVKKMVHAAPRYGQLLREEIGATVVDPSEIDSELRHLLSASGRGKRLRRNFSAGFVFRAREFMWADELSRLRAPLLTGGGLEGRCARCLLELAIEESQGGEPLSSEAITARTSSDASGLLRPTLILGERYRLLRLLGRGGQGEVWHAFDLKLRVEVALKSLRPDAIRDARGERLRRVVPRTRQVSADVCGGSIWSRGRSRAGVVEESWAAHAIRVIGNEGHGTSAGREDRSQLLEV